ncbi:MAG: efflux RND transporter periplasmic adaptor subunit [FCB group bacterium]|nr:efflux RND transporter periplasmic adaptor subunit [FCB group bacterium]
MKNILNIKSLVFIIVLILLAFVIGRWTGSNTASGDVNTVHNHTEEESTTWTCSMHPQIQLPEAGQCPICFMDLIPAESSASGENPRQLKLSPAAVALADIRTTSVIRKTASAQINLSGSVDYDETLIGRITARFPGRLEHLYVDFTGIRVSKGDRLADLYSPDLISAQEELLQASRHLSSLKDKKSPLYVSAEMNLKSVREKLRLLGLSPEQIRDMQTGKTLNEQVAIYSPLTGIVIHKNALEGEYVKTGTPIYTIADLSRVWIILDAYESDLAWLKYGQDVSVTTEAHPGEIFTGKIAFIDPILNTKTRTARIRLNLDNPRQLLKPGMFVRAMIQSRLDADGNSINPDLAGKWISPMHPEVIKDQPGVCEICGMPLVPAEDLGFVSMPGREKLPLMVPVSSVLKTGNRSLVYVRLPDTEEPVFESREIISSTRAGDNYIVLEGLSEGDQVVVNGNFKIDSAMQLSGKTSMMNPDTEPGLTDKDNESDVKSFPDLILSKQLLSEILDLYLKLQASLADDDFSASRNTFLDIHNLTMAVPGAEPVMAPTMQNFTDLTELRTAFDELSEVMRYAARSGLLNHPVNEAYCPMAFDFRGAYWLQEGEVIDNPYFGSQMLRCGEIKQRWPSPESSK